MEHYAIAVEINESKKINFDKSNISKYEFIAYEKNLLKTTSLPEFIKEIKNTYEKKSNNLYFITGEKGKI